MRMLLMVWSYVQSSEGTDFYTERRNVDSIKCEELIPRIKRIPR